MFFRTFRDEGDGVKGKKELKFNGGDFFFCRIVFYYDLVGKGCGVV